MIDFLKSWCTTHLTPQWLLAFAPYLASFVALIIAVFGKGMRRWWYHPKLDLKADVQRPDAEKARRPVPATAMRDVEFAYYFRLAIRNNGNAPARNVQVFLARVEKMIDNKPVEVARFTPMNLTWSYIADTTRKLIVPKAGPIFCDFIHVSDPASRTITPDEDLPTVPSGDVVLFLEVEALPLNKANLLEPGTYRFHLVLAAENSSPRRRTVEVWCPGRWFDDQQEMFDKGFKMKKV